MEYKRERKFKDHWARSGEDPLYFFATELKIINKEHQVQPLFPLRRGQKKLYDAWWSQFSLRNYVRMIVNKGRQVGSSTLFCALIYWLTVAKGNRKALVTAHHAGSTATLFNEKIKFFHERISGQMRFPKKRSNRAELILVTRKEGASKDDDKFWGQIAVETAGSPEAARSRTLSDLLLSEVAFFEDMGALVNAAFNSVADDVGTMVLESTSNGVGNYWHTLHEKRGDTLTDYERIFVSWMDDDGYTKSVTSAWASKYYRLRYVAGALREIKSPQLAVELALLQKELAIIDYDVVKIVDYQPTAEQYAWYQYTLHNKSKGHTLLEKIDSRNQENPYTVEDSFIGSGRPTFDREKLYEMLKHSTPGERRIMIVERDDEEVDVIKTEPDISAMLQVWDEPDPEGKYIISVDTDSGAGGDNTAIHCYRVMGDDLIQVASLSQVSLRPADSATEAARLGYLYNTATIIPETGVSATGTAFLMYLKEVLLYPMIYREISWDKDKRKQSQRYGWWTTKSSRLLMIQKAIERLSSGHLHLRSPSTIKEMTTMQYDMKKGRHDHPHGENDDEVIAVCIACAVAERRIRAYNRNPTPKKPKDHPMDSVARHDAMVLGRMTAAIKAPNYLDDWKKTSRM